VITADIQSLLAQLQSCKTLDELAASVPNVQHQVAESYDFNIKRIVTDLRIMLEDLIAWLDAKLANHKIITILGI
jgi:hypothetical protein